MNPSPPRPVAPERALLHPLWWFALAVLAVNDHVLKHADVLPGVVTGKLSDVAGLIVAPVLVAAIVRARGRGARLACHTLVGIVFAAIQLSPQAGVGWNAVLGLVGVQWRIWPDPWDLACLPALAISWRLLGRPGAAPRWRALAVRAIQVAAVALGGVFCMATSPPDPEPTCCTSTPIQAEVYLHNSAGTDVVVRRRVLDPTVSIDCDAVAADPARMLADDTLFAPATTWTMPAWTTLPAADPDPARGCNAVRIAGGQFDERLLFWRTEAFPAQSVPGYLDRELEDDASLPSGAVFLLRGDEDTAPVVLDDRGQGLITEALEPGPVELPGQRCEVPGDEVRLAWSEPLPRGRQRIEAVEVGPDDCLAVDLSALDDDRAQRWYLCLPPEAWPFSVGATIEIAEMVDATGPVGLTVTRQSATSRTDLVLARDAGPTLFAGDDLVSVRPIEATECALVSSPGCGTLTRPATLQVDARGASHTVRAGQRARFDTGAWVLEVFGVVASVRPVVAASCSGGPADRGDDVELVLLRREILP